VHAARLLPALVAAALVLPGCVERRLRIQTEPSGARVSLNGVPLGTTPVEVPFLHYGDVRVEVEPFDGGGDGSPDTRRCVTVVPLSPPWYQWPVIDFFSDNLWPWTVVDRHEARIRLPPCPDADDPGEGQAELRRLEKELRARARDARREAGAPAPDGKK
jgi:hypothetical protein